MKSLGLLPRPWLYFLLALTALAILPWEPQGPFDARDWSTIEGVRLAYPWSGVFMEPLLAPAHALMGAPDFRVALAAAPVWIVALAIVVGAATACRGRRLRRALAWALFALGGVLLYVAFIALLHLPGWRLVVDDPDLLVGDFQTHTFGSHDGLVTADQNLRWHRAHGYDLIGITEHNDPRGSFAMQAEAHALPDGPAVIAGVEVSDENDKFLLGVGLDPAKGVLPWKGNQEEFARKFIAHVHAQGGAVIALAWLLEPQHVLALADAGLDAIELVNTGHPDIDEGVRDTILSLARDRPLALMGSTDWHGWGGFTRTWTLVRLPAAAANQEERASAVVERLRARDAAAFTPIAAGYMGPPGAFRALFAPWVEAVRYAAELSPERVISWWAWAFLISVAAAALRKRGVRPAPVLGGALAASLGAFVGGRALELVSYRTQGAPHDYAVEMGMPGLLIAAAALGVASAVFWREWRRVRGSTSDRVRLARNGKK